MPQDTPSQDPPLSGLSPAAGLMDVDTVMTETVVPRVHTPPPFRQEPGGLTSTVTTFSPVRGDYYRPTNERSDGRTHNSRRSYTTRRESRPYHPRNQGIRSSLPQIRERDRHYDAWPTLEHRSPVAGPYRPHFKPPGEAHRDGHFSDHRSSAPGPSRPQFRPPGAAHRNSGRLSDISPDSAGHPKTSVASSASREAYFVSACETSALLQVGAVLPNNLPLQGILEPSATTVLPDAVVELTARSELLLRYWHALMPMKSFDLLLVRLLQSGGYARIGRDGNAMTLVPPISQVPPPHPTSLSAPPNIGITPEGQINRRKMRLRRTDSECCVIYLATIPYLRGRPEVRRCLTHGGILWRLVLCHFGSADLLAALNGPSPAAVHWRSGDVDPHSQLFDDELPRKVIDVLVGVTTDGLTFWPPPDPFDTTINFPGVWTSSLESWFTSRANAINAHTAAPLSRSGWKNVLSFWTNTQWTATTNVGTEGFAQALLERASVDVPDDWASWVHPHRIVRRSHPQ